MARKIQNNLRQVVSNLQSTIAELKKGNLDDVSVQRWTQAKAIFEDTYDIEATYLRNLKDALSSNPEFNDTHFSQPLVQLVKSQKLFYYEYSTKSIKMDMNGVAGKVDLWGKAVANARKMADKGKSPPDKASYYWQMMYKAAREGSAFVRETRSGKGKDITKSLVKNYWAAIKNRLGTRGLVAPWWYILEVGVAGAGELSSNRGGWAYPKARATHFVRNTEIALTVALRTTIKKVELARLEKELVDKKKLLKDLNGSFTGKSVPYYTYVVEGRWAARSKTSGQFVSKDYVKRHPGSTRI